MRSKAWRCAGVGSLIFSKVVCGSWGVGPSLPRQRPDCPAPGAAQRRRLILTKGLIRHPGLAEPTDGAD